MNNPAPSNDPHDAMREALRRDAARTPEPPFDAALHHAMMRRIRTLSEPSSRQSGWWWKPALATASALVVVLVVLVVRPPDSPEGQMRPATRVAQHDVDAALATARAVVARASFESAQTVPSWMSPSASLLEPPRMLSASVPY